MKPSLAGHWKLRALAKALGVSVPSAIGTLELLWNFTASHAPSDGDLSDQDAFAIAAACYWDGEPDALVDALVACRLLDRDGDGLRVHDWLDHRPKYLDHREQTAERRRRTKPDQQGSSDNVRAQPRTVRAPSPTVPNNLPPPSAPLCSEREEREGVEPVDRTRGTPRVAVGAPGSSSSSSAGRGRRPPGIAWSEREGFTGIDAEQRDRWAAIAPSVDIDRELVKAHQWLLDNPAKRKKRVAKFLTTWLDTAQQRATVAPRDGPIRFPAAAQRAHNTDQAIAEVLSRRATAGEAIETGR